MYKIYLLSLFAPFLFYGGILPVKISGADQYFQDKLASQKEVRQYEEDSDFGYIKIGNFLKVNTKNAIVVSFDSITSLTVYELRNHRWVPFYRQDNVNLERMFPLQAFTEDFNFDGVRDIGIQNEVSNGAAIMTVHLWLSDGNSFKYIPEFEEIGNPVIVKKANIVQGFEACCAYSELTLADYQWEGSSLVKIRQLEISNYQYGAGIEANMTYVKEQRIRPVKITKKDIAAMIHKYNEDWKLVDNATKNIKK